MTPQFPKLNEPRPGVGPSLCMARSLFAHELIEENKAEVLRFLAERPLHNVVMSGFVRDNGIESWLNRGTFYGCRDDLGNLEGVALIGHAMFIDARSGEALGVFARLAQTDAGETTRQ